MLVSVVDDGRRARKSTSTDVDSRRMSVDEKVAASVVADKNLIAMADNNDNYENRATDGNELKEFSMNEKDVDSKPTMKECTGLVSLPSKERNSKKKKKKKASQIKGTGSDLNNTQSDEVKSEEHSSFEGILTKLN